MEHGNTETFSENLLALLCMKCCEIGVHAKCLLFGWPTHGGKSYCCNISARFLNLWATGELLMGHGLT